MNPCFNPFSAVADHFTADRPLGFDWRQQPASDWSRRITWHEHWPLIGRLPSWLYLRGSHPLARRQSQIPRAQDSSGMISKVTIITRCHQNCEYQDVCNNPQLSINRVQLMVNEWQPGTKVGCLSLWFVQNYLKTVLNNWQDAQSLSYDLLMSLWPLCHGAMMMS